MQMKMSFEIQDLKVSYKVFNGELHVIDGLNLKLSAGERMGLVGEAGCGKTTTLKTVLGILPRNAIIRSGKILFNGEDILEFNDSRIQRFRQQECAMIFQDPSSALNPIFKIKDLMINGMKNSLAHLKRNWKKVAYAEAVNALQEVMLPDPERIMENYPFQLSGGMRQRVCIAMAIATDRHLLLADEPTTSLDVTIQEQILHLIHRLSLEKGLAVVLVTHSMGVIREMTDRVSVMYAGSIVEVGDTKDVLEDPQHPYTQALIACIPKLTGSGVAEGIPGRVPDYQLFAKGCRYVDRCPYATKICYEQKPLLLDCGTRREVACHNCRRPS